MASQKLAYSSLVPVPDGLLESESLFPPGSGVFQQESAEPGRLISLVEAPRVPAPRAAGVAGDGVEAIRREIQLSNQQLQATNEQLEVNRDALDSVRQLLHRIGGETASRNDLLVQLTRDLTHLLNTVDVPIVMVGSDLRVRRFTAQAATVLGLTPADIGRSLSRLRLRVDLHGLEARMFDVLRDGQPCHRQLQDKAGSRCSVGVVPCRTMDDGRVDGLVLTFSGCNSSPESSRKPISTRPVKKTALRATDPPRNS